jgi:hypothetical protein
VGELLGPFRMLQQSRMPGTQSIIDTPLGIQMSLGLFIKPPSSLKDLFFAVDQTRHALERL